MFTQLLAEHFVQTALWAGAVAAVVSGAIGVFVVARGMSFAVHAISELGFTGAAGALVIGIDPVIGILGGSLLVGLVLGLLSLRGRERDSAIGAVLAFGLGLGYLFFSLYQGYATEALNLLFGNILGVSDAQLRNLVIVGAVVLLGLALLYRPLFFSSVDPEIAAARGVPLRALSVAIFLLLALTTAEAIQVVGVLLVLTLVITPAAAAQRLTGTARARAAAQHRRSRSSRPRAGSCSRSRSRGRRASSSPASRSPRTSRLGSTTGTAAVSARSRGRQQASGLLRLWSIRRVRWSDVCVAASLPAATVILYSTGRSCSGVLKLPDAVEDRVRDDAPLAADEPPDRDGRARIRRDLAREHARAERLHLHARSDRDRDRRRVRARRDEAEGRARARLEAEPRGLLDVPQRMPGAVGAPLLQHRALHVRRARRHRHPAPVQQVGAAGRERQLPDREPRRQQVQRPRHLGGAAAR